MDGLLVLHLPILFPSSVQCITLDLVPSHSVLILSFLLSSSFPSLHHCSLSFLSLSCFLDGVASVDLLFRTALQEQMAANDADFAPLLSLAMPVLSTQLLRTYYSWRQRKTAQAVQQQQQQQKQKPNEAGGGMTTTAPAASQGVSSSSSSFVSSSAPSPEERLFGSLIFIVADVVVLVVLILLILSTSYLFLHLLLASFGHRRFFSSGVEREKGRKG